MSLKTIQARLRQKLRLMQNVKRDPTVPEVVATYHRGVEHGLEAALEMLETGIPSEPLLGMRSAIWDDKTLAGYLTRLARPDRRYHFLARELIEQGWTWEQLIAFKKRNNLDSRLDSQLENAFWEVGHGAWPGKLN